jgi:cellulose synthase/poly-beta-1,6-N-acetylglucosamine synthase-like glycosyltransferase
MPPITALLHTRNDAMRLGRALEMLLPCSEVLIVDHHSTDATWRIAREYGAHIVTADTPTANHYLDLAGFDWIFCIETRESITEGLQASLFEWSAQPSPTAVSGVPDGPAFSVFVRKQTREGWLEPPAPETRLIPRNWTLWRGRLPAPQVSSIALDGKLLRFDLP